MQDHPVIKLIQQSNYLPEIPREFGETLCMLLEPCEFFIDECIGKLSRIPNLELTLIQALNYNSKLGREIVDLKDAVLYLGAKNTRMIAIVYITRLLLPSRNGRAKIFDKKKYWKHCIGTSIASYMIAAETGLCDKEKIFTYGLIHDIGTTVYRWRKNRSGETFCERRLPNGAKSMSYCCPSRQGKARPHRSVHRHTAS